jgi:3-oxoacyl-[acyl-carrier protein] reductase
MAAQLRGRNALVTGGTRGIGRGIAIALAGEGANVLACSSSGGEAAEKLAIDLKETSRDRGVPGDHHVLQADVTVVESMRALADECRARLGSLDVIVHNAGVISHVPIGELSLIDWRRVIDTSLTGAFLVVQKMLPLLGRNASVINVGSRAARAGIPLRAHYTAAKAGLEGLTRSLAKELGPRGVRVNVVAPGLIDTDQDRQLPPERRAEIARQCRALTALGRMGTVEEVAGAVLFLASDLSRYVTGQVLDVDGGI